MKPRCLYSRTAPQLMKPAPDEGQDKPPAAAIKACREYAVEMLAEAQRNLDFVCGMQPFDPDHEMYGVICARESLECHDPIEFEYYSNPRTSADWCDTSLCAYCAGTCGTGYVDEELRLEYKTVLPVCKECRDDGAQPLARVKHRLGSAQEDNRQRTRQRQGRREESVPTENQVELDTPAHPQPNQLPRRSRSTRKQVRAGRADSSNPLPPILPARRRLRQRR